VALKRIDHEYLGITGQGLALGRNFSAAEIQRAAGTRLIRTEIGARLAFGARSRHIVLMLVKDNLAAVASGSVASAAVALLVLPGVQPRFDAHAFDVRWVDGALALGALALLAVLVCYLSARPLLSQSPATVLREAGR
jgi:ABC-type antimicrobial peptide transport system permease subunit